ncbi:MAG: rod-binding protein [Thermoguttaceae bacterium]|jgi:Rod binding domain-containing protein
MNTISPLTTAAFSTTQAGQSPSPQNPRLRKAFDQFVGESFYGQMLKAMRKTVEKPAYLNGGNAEDMFTGQLDQILAQKLAGANGNQFTGAMYQLFTLQRQ